MTSSAKTCYALFLGCLEYEQALQLMTQICELKKRGLEEDVLLLLEHPPTVTLGRNGRWQHLLVSDDELQSKGVRRFEVDRGGDITFHGPGQLVGYPILKLEREERDVRRYMRHLEEVLIRLLAAYGIEAHRHEGLTGVWTRHGKIAALGVHISRWITRHGFALNVNTDLSFFDLIVPCGIAGKEVASMSSILSQRLELPEVAENLVHEFGPALGRDMIWLSASVRNYGDVCGGPREARSRSEEEGDVGTSLTTSDAEIARAALRPAGGGGPASSALSLLLDDAQASPSSSLRASEATAHATNVTVITNRGT